MYLKINLDNLTDGKNDYSFDHLELTEELAYRERERENAPVWIRERSIERERRGYGEATEVGKEGVMGLKKGRGDEEEPVASSHG